MKYVLTKHAQERIFQRNIPIIKIIETINNYQLKELEDEVENKIAFYRKIDDNLILKVVTIQNNEEIRVITVYPIDEKRLKKVKNLIEIK